MSCCSHNDRFERRGMCTVSNIAYIIPVIVVMINFPKHHNIHILALFTFILLCSSTSYHMCRGECNEFPKHRGLNLCQEETPICRLRSKRSTLFELRDMDYVVAIMSMAIVFVTIVPLKLYIRIGYIVIVGLWLMFNIDSTSAYESNKMMLLTIPLIPMSILICLIPLVFKNDTASQRIKWVWICGIIMFFLAGLCFLNVLHDSYTVNHSLWHIFSAISVAVIISVSQQNSEHIDVSKFSAYKLLSVCQSVFNRDKNNTSIYE